MDQNRQPRALRGTSFVLSTPSVPRHPPIHPRLAPGFRFYPTDEELVVYYLRSKVCRKPFHFEAIAEVDIYKFEPWELHAFCGIKTRDQEWHFFTAYDHKYRTGSRVNRSTSQGHWKATGKDRLVLHKNEVVATKKTLIYYGGRAPNGIRTNWAMHEYRLVDRELAKIGVEQSDSFMICKIFMKSETVPHYSGVHGPFIEEEWENDAQVMVPCGDNNNNNNNNNIADNEDSQGLFGLFSGKKCAQENHNNAAPSNNKVGALDSSSLEMSLPPGYLKFITDLEEEREKLKVALMESQAIINSLQESNEELEEEIRRLRSLHLKD